MKKTWKDIPWYIRFRASLWGHFNAARFLYLWRIPSEQAGEEFVSPYIEVIKFNREIAQVFVNSYLTTVLCLKLTEKNRVHVVLGKPPLKHLRRSNLKLTELKKISGLYCRNNRTIYIMPRNDSTNETLWGTLLHETAHIQHFNHGFKFLVEMYRILVFSNMLAESLAEVAKDARSKKA